MVMKTELDQIYQNRLKKKKQLSNDKENYIVAIYKSLTNKKNAHAELRKQTINDKRLYLYAEKAADKLNRKINSYKERPDNNKIFSFIEKLLMFEAMDKIINQDVRDEAVDEKYEVIDKSLTNNGEKVFFLASSHSDCAKDHLKYQGKLYFDEKYKNKVKNPEKITKYIKNHNLRSFQWVIGKPVYFITRPYCRHYFVQLSYDDIKDKTLDELKTENKTHSAVGDRGPLQTPKIRNAEATLEKYYERLRLHQRLYQEQPCELLKNAINKDKILIQKWRKYLFNLKKR